MAFLASSLFMYKMEFLIILVIYRIGECFYIKMLFYQLKDSLHNNTMVPQTSYLFIGIPIPTVCARAPIQYKMSSYQYWKSYYADKMILRPSYFHNGISYTGHLYIAMQKLRIILYIHCVSYHMIFYEVTKSIL